MTDSKERGLVLNVTWREGLVSVYQSQVLTPMKHLRRAGFDTASVVLAPVGELLRPELRRRWKAVRASAAESLSAGLHVWPSPPSRLRNVWNERPVLALAAARAARGRRGRFVVQSRGPDAALLSLESRAGGDRAIHVFDCRGVVGPELLMEAGYERIEDAPPALQARVREAEKASAAAAAGAQALVCVSQNLKRMLVAKHGVGDKPLVVVPCCADRAMEADEWAAARKRVRALLGFGDEPVVAYCGSTRAWQCPEESVRLFAEIRRSLPTARFLCVTTSPPAFLAACARHGVDERAATVVSVPHSQVADYLAAADAGLLLRAPSPVNEAASPVKFAEYLCSGLPVAATFGIGDTTEFVREHGTGACLTWPPTEPDAVATAVALVERTVADRTAAARNCLDAARRHLVWESVVPRLAAFHRELLDA